MTKKPTMCNVVLTAATTPEGVLVGAPSARPGLSPEYSQRLQAAQRNNTMSE